MGLKVDNNAGISADVEPAVAANSNTQQKLMGYSCRESAGTPAVAAFNLIHGATVAGGTQVVSVELAANGSETVMLGAGIDCPDGISIEVVAGTVDVQVYY